MPPPRLPATPYLDRQGAELLGGDDAFRMDTSPLWLR